MKGKKETELLPEERDKLEALIDEAFRKVILLPREQDLVDFFVKVQDHRHEFRGEELTEKLKVVDVFYYANCPLGFIAIEPSYDFYDWKKTSSRAELKLGHYVHSHIEDIVIDVLDENQIDYSVLSDDCEFDTAIFWENQDMLEMQFIVDCWGKAKEKTKSEVLGFLQASDGSGGPYDLRNGFDLWGEKGSISDYLERQGVIIEKEPKQHPKGKKSGFWRRLFG